MERVAFLQCFYPKADKNVHVKSTKIKANDLKANDDRLWYLQALSELQVYTYQKKKLLKAS